MKREVFEVATGGEQGARPLTYELEDGTLAVIGADMFSIERDGRSVIVTKEDAELILKLCQ